MDADQELLEHAKAAAARAYAPYSKFRVGAAVRAGDRMYSGCNVENASYGLSICAERVAIFAAIAAGEKSIDALALACLDADTSQSASEAVPCGACRQVMSEFGRLDMPIQLASGRITLLRNLLPEPFSLNKS